MTGPFRLIPRLDVKGSLLVKGIRLEGLRPLGNPSEFALEYARLGADELMLMDAVASLYRRNSLHQLVAEVSEIARIPLTVGGGIRTLEDARQLLDVGADKVAINSAAVERPEIIDEVANEFGSSTVVASIQSVWHRVHGPQAFFNNGRDNSGKEVLSWALELEKRGAGEILLFSADRDGTKQGLDLELATAVSSSLQVPCLLGGGAGNIQHFLDAAPLVEGIVFSSFSHKWVGRRLAEESVSLPLGRQGPGETHTASEMEKGSGFLELKNTMVSRGFFTRPNHH